MMDICRTCLKTPANKYILELEKDLKEGNQDCFRIMWFCLDIEVSNKEDSKVSKKLCNNCYRKIISFYKFKTLSLKNDAYLKSLEQTQLEDQKLSVYVDENGIKRENLIDSEEFQPSLEFEIEIDLKVDRLFGGAETNVKNEDTYEQVESDEEPLSVVREVKYENTKEDCSENEAVCTKHEQHNKGISQNIENETEKWHGKSVHDLEAHLVQHQRKGEQSVFYCELCPKFFATKSGRAQHHKFIHLGISRVKSKPKCNICNKEVKFLKEHMMHKHNPETLPYDCVLCKRRFLSRSTLATHMATHEDVQELPPYECDMCHKRFRSKDIVSKHIRKIHLNEKNYRCKICPKTFFTKQPFIHHMDRHSNKRRYKCDKCGLALKTQDTLRRHHISIHSDVRKFQCTVCSKGFKLHSSLWAHMVSHTKEKRYPCRFCGVRFGRSDHRNRHQLTTHKNQ